MAYFADNHSREVNELRVLLRSPEIQRTPDRYVDVVKRAIMYMTAGMDLSPLFTEMVMATSTRNLVQKKLVYLFLCTYAETNTELALLAINTLQKDCRDQDPVVRGLALRALCSLRISAIVEYVTPPLKAGLADPSPYVRKTAIMGCVKMFHLAPRVVRESDVVDRLYALIRDRDPIVLANSVAALDEILAEEGGMALNRPLALHLFQQLRILNEWGQSMIMTVLARYKPEDDDEVFSILNILDERLKHANGVVVMAAARLFLQYTDGMESQIVQDVCQRVKEPLLTLLTSGGPEMVYVCLAHFQLLYKRVPMTLEDDFKYFFLRSTDPAYIRSQKLDMLVNIATERNAVGILDELYEYATDMSATVAARSIRSIGDIVLRVPNALGNALDKVLALAELDMDHVTAECLVVAQELVMRFPQWAGEILTRLRPCLRTIDVTDAKISLLYLVGEHGDKIDNAPYILEPLIDGLKDERSPAVRLALLTATAKLFLKRPPEVQSMLGRLLNKELSGEVAYQTEPHDRALLYYRLLSHGVDAARKVIDATREPVSAATDAAEEAILSKLFLELNTLSVIYGRPSELFIQQRPPYAKVPVPERTHDERPQRASSQPAKAERAQPAPAPAPAHAVSPAIPSPSLTAASAPAVGDLLDLAPASTAAPAQPASAAPPALQLGVLAKLDAKGFQGSWGAFGAGLAAAVPLSRVAARVADIERAVTASGEVAVMASGGSGDQLKFYFYTGDVATQTLLLLEVKVTVSTATASATAKGGARPDGGARSAPLDAADTRLGQLLAWLQQVL